ncbi:MAG: polysaccharide pyruvyl transferase family protein [Clostridia bacterium]|nr:polysaccharide pyruvyl transferase family protein [Clostridia bacterium]
MEKIWVKGFFQKNLGDDIFLKILTERYRNVMFESFSNYDYKILTENIKNLKFYNKYSFFNISRKLFEYLGKNLKTEKIYNKYDKIVIIGGSLFIENENTNLKFHEEVYNFRKPYYILGSNFGPYKTKEYIDIHKNKIFKNAEDVCFRESYSFKLFKELNNVRKASDIVFSLDTTNIKNTNNKKVIISVINCSKDGKYIIEQEKYNKKIIELIKYFEEKGYEVTLISFSKPQGDEKVIEDILQCCSSNMKIDKYFYRGNIDEALNVLADSQIIVGTRLHANILGLILNKTIIPIVYSDKTLNILSDIKFKGKIFDIRDEKSFVINTINDEQLNYKLDVSFQIKDAEKHFQVLDKVLENK